MGYTISEAAEKMGMVPHTLRYYEKEGLLPFVGRTSGGIRCFKDSDFEWLSVINCLKGTGMQIKDIKQFIDWCMEGDSTLRQRLEMFKERKEEVNRQISVLQNYMEKIDMKIQYYERAIEAGTEAVHSDSSCES